MAESPSELRAEIEKLERKHAGNPEGRYFVPLANDYRKLGDLARAEQLLREGLRKHPDYLSAHIVLGRCLADREKRVEAAEEFTFVLSMDPQNLIALRSLGELALADGRREEAARWYRELLAVDPMNDEARQALATLESPAQPAALPAAEDAPAWWDSGGHGELSGVEPQEATSAEAERASPPEQARSAASQMEDPADENRFGRFVDLDSGDLDSAGDGSDLQPDQPARPAFLELGDSDEPADEIESVEVVTETIAELYARQGLHDRAIGVYRELIRRRGGDPALERRLAELERAVGTGDREAESVSQEFAPPEFAADLVGEDWEVERPDNAGHEEAGDLVRPAFSARPEGDEIYGDLADLSGLSVDEPPEDPVRRACLQDLDVEDRQAQSSSPSETGDEAPHDRGDAGARSDRSGVDHHDPFADSFENGFVGVSPPASSMSEGDGSDIEEEPGQAEEEQATAADAGRFEVTASDSEGAAAQPSASERERPQTIAEYLAALAAWTPGTRAADERVRTTAAPIGSEPETATHSEEETDTGQEPAAVPAAEGDWDAEPFPWELPPQAGASAAPVKGEAEAEASLEEPSAPPSWTAAESQDDEDSEAEPQIGLADYFPEESAGPGTSVTEAEPDLQAPRQDAEIEDDDDLESFQAWLRSLKR